MVKLFRIYIKQFKCRILDLSTASFCKHCGRDVHDFIVADEIWEEIEPHIKRGHTLCYDCFCDVCQAVGLPSAWMLTSINKSKIITLCGSSRFVDIMAICAWLLERDEKAITMGLHLLPQWYCKDRIPDHLAEFEGVAEAMDRLHLYKIDLSGEIFVVNRNNYIGDSTRREIAYAQSTGKYIRWYTDDPIGEKVEAIVKERSNDAGH